jgi:S1-C subfamily serine protease
MIMKQIKITLIFVFSLMLIKSIANAELLLPQDTAAFKRSSVRVYNKKKNSGGTGSILKSTKNGSKILTNKHVCRLIEQGGYVEQNETYYPVESYKKFDDHDLCLISVEYNFNISLRISKTIAKPSDTIYVSGHPRLLPHILTKGHLSDNMRINLIIGVVPCEKPSMECMFFGGEPIIREFDSQVISNLISPGSSGSAVFNDAGEIVGVVFAGMGELSRGFIVPQKYILYFLTMARYTDFVPVGTKVDDKGLLRRIFNEEKCKKIKSKRIRKKCKAKHSMLYFEGLK